MVSENMVILIHTTCIEIVLEYFDEVFEFAEEYSESTYVATTPKEINTQLKLLNLIIGTYLTTEHTNAEEIEHSIAYRKSTGACFFISHHNFNHIGLKFHADFFLTIEIDMPILKDNYEEFIISVANRLSYEFSRLPLGMGTTAIQLLTGADCFYLEKINNSISYMQKNS